MVPVEIVLDKDKGVKAQDFRILLECPYIRVFESIITGRIRVVVLDTDKVHVDCL